MKSTASGKACVTFSRRLVNNVISSPFLWNWVRNPSYLVSQSAHPISSTLMSIPSDNCASIGFTGLPGINVNFLSPSSPSSFATFATSPKSFVNIWALSATALSTSNAWDIASRMIPSPTPILSSSKMVLQMYFASFPEAEDKSSRILEILRAVDLLPDIVANFLNWL